MAESQSNRQSVDPNQRAFAINGQYIKDLSFESPDAPRSLFSLKDKPAIDLQIDIKGQKLQEKTYEVAIQIGAKATAEGTTVFLVELEYAGIFTISDALAEDALEPVLLVECPRVLFPFARRVVADVTRDGGFPPLMLDPIDFLSLYQARKGQAGDEAKAATATA